MAATNALHPDSNAGASKHHLAISIAVSLFAFVTCYFRTFIFPGTPLLPNGDQTGFVYAGSRLAAGELPYRDYFQIVPPGTDLTYALVIRAFGLRLWIPHIAMALLAAVAALLMTRIALRVLPGTAAALPGLLLIGFVLPESADATHHWFSTVVALAAVFVLLGGSTLGRVAAAGALCGLTACFTQTKGAAMVAAFCIFFVWEAGLHKSSTTALARQCAVLAAFAATTFAAFNIYFVAAAGLRQWWFCIIVYPLRYYSAPSVNNWRVLEHDFGWHGGLIKWIAYPFIYATVPLACIVFLAVTRRRWKDGDQPWRQLVLIALTGCFMFLPVVLAPSVKRVGSVAPLAMISLAWLLYRSGPLLRQFRQGLAIGTVALAVAVPVRTQTHWHAFLDLPAGRTAFHEKTQLEEYAWVLTHTHPGQFFSGMPPMFVPFHLVNPSAIAGYDTTEYTRPEQISELLQSLRTHAVPLMILPSEQKYLHPTGLPSDHLGSFRDYLYSNYVLTQTFPSGDEVWEQKADANAASQ